MTSSLRGSFVLLAVLGLVAVACDGGPTQPPGTPGISVSGIATDTIGSLLRAPLVVQVTDAAGRPAVGTAVHLRAELITDPHGRWPDSPGLRLANTADGGSSYASLDLVTDLEGTVRAYVKLGGIAGPAAVEIEAPSHGFTASAPYTILPGRPVGVSVLPRDTSVYAGGSFAIHATVVDRFGNARPADPLTLSVDDPSVAGLASGRLTGVAFGRAALVARHEEGFTDTAFVSVVPTGHLVTMRDRVAGTDPWRLVYLDLDGSGYREVEARPQDRHPRWLPTGDGILVVGDGDGVSGLSHVTVVDAGGRRRLVPDSIDLAQTADPEPGGDGWIYFAGDPPVGQRYTEIWRIRPDGAGAERVSEPAGYYHGFGAPSLSSDGRLLAYMATTENIWPALRVRTLSSGAVLDFGNGIRGEAPSFSPTDPELLVLGVPAAGSITMALEIHAMQADGTRLGRVSAAGRSYRAPFRWSPDGRWLVAENFGTGALELIEYGTGLTLPLGFTEPLGAPAWKP